MIVKKIHKKDLEQFIKGGEYLKSTYLPISAIRGLAQAKNPRALPDDLLLVIMFENNEMLGYLGVLPDDLYYRNEEGEAIEVHVGWLSCIWVDPSQRGRGIAKNLLKTVFEDWDANILATEFTALAKALYDSTEKFTDLTKPTGIRAYMRLNLSYLLPAKNPDKWTKFKFLLKVTDSILNIIFDIRRSFIRKKKVQFSIIPEIDSEAKYFIDQNRLDDELMKRNVSDLEWIINNPWLNSGQKADDLSKRYHFSSVADYFAFKVMKVYNQENQLAAVLLLSIRDRNVKVPYVYYSPGASALISDALENYMREQKYNMLTVFHAELCNEISNNGSAYFNIRKMYRHYLISNKFKSELKELKTLIIQDGDADASFT
jgi:GNAT superfamily N-acetyltransferase